jgi:hypothetical protein
VREPRTGEGNGLVDEWPCCVCCCWLAGVGTKHKVEVFHPFVGGGCLAVHECSLRERGSADVNALVWGCEARALVSSVVAREALVAESV